ncbi:MAG: uroporphyrinogen-III C-methyltransferase, partial [Sphingomicrobium sp.]
PDTPVMIAVDVSLPSERLIRGKLSALAFLVRTISDDDPTLLLIGEAVAASERTAALPAAAMADA